MRGIMFRWAVNAGGLLLVSYLFAGIQVDHWGWAFIAAIFLGVFNALIRPVIFILTLPINVLTLGLFTLVINGLMLWLTGQLLAGFHVQGFWTAVFGALILALISMAVNWTVGEKGQAEIVRMQQDPNGHWR